jgi:hypothetical protein
VTELHPAEFQPDPSHGKYTGFDCHGHHDTMHDGKSSALASDIIDGKNRIVIDAFQPREGVRSNSWLENIQYTVC